MHPACLVTLAQSSWQTTHRRHHGSACIDRATCVRLLAATCIAGAPITTSPVFHAARCRCRARSVRAERHRRSQRGPVQRARRASHARGNVPFTSLARELFYVRCQPCRVMTTTRSSLVSMPPHARSRVASLRIRPLPKGAMRCVADACGCDRDSRRHHAQRATARPMCATSLIASKKQREMHACRLRINKVFVYFTNLKMRGLASTL